MTLRTPKSLDSKHAFRALCITNFSFQYRWAHGAVLHDDLFGQTVA